MAIANRISEVIPANVVADVITKLTDAHNLLKPYLLTTLTTADIEGLAKLGEKSEPFANKGIEFAKTNGSLVPSWVNIKEAEADMAVFDVLRPVDIFISQFAKEVFNTRIEAGAEVMDAMNDFYKSVQMAHNNGVAAATPIYEELKQRYVANGRKSKDVPKP